MVTHELGFARETADAVYFLEGGRIEESGTPDQVFNSPASERTARFIAAVTRYPTP
jgi:polar amino acid transport system permease protein